MLYQIVIERSKTKIGMFEVGCSFAIVFESRFSEGFASYFKDLCEIIAKTSPRGLRPCGMHHSKLRTRYFRICSVYLGLHTQQGERKFR